MVKYCVFVLFLLHLNSFGQSNDRLKTDETLEGVERVTYLNDLSKQYFNNDQVKAMGYANEALVLARSIGDKAGESASLNNIGVIHKNRGRLDMALSSYLESVHIEETEKLTARLAGTYSNIGTIYSLQGEFDKALEFFNKARQEFVQTNDKPQIIGALNNIGNVFTGLNKPDSALNYYQRSLELYESLEDRNGVFVPYGNIGNIHFREGDLDLALRNFNKSLELEKANNDLDGQANALHSIGLVYKLRQQTEKAIASFEEALSIVQETGNKRLLTMIYESLAETYFMQNDPFMAYSFLKLHSTVKDSLFNEENSRRIAELESRFELESAENELRELRSKNEIQNLRIQNDNIFMIAIVIVSVMGIVFTVIVVKELQQIKKNKKLLERKNNELNDQKLIIEEKNQSITESIDYAKSVQRSLLQFEISQRLNENLFTLFKPKDIVSGDFFWYSECDGKDIIAAVDCTGHGVAGAFMTVIGSSCLDQIINKDHITSPATILENLSIAVSKALKQSMNGRSDHGMDIALCMIDYKKRELRFAGANRPLYYFQNDEFKEIKGARRSIGNMEREGDSFAEHIVPFLSGDTFYLTSDGYADQFGGVRNKKYMIGNFKKMLTSIQHVSLNEQKSRLRASLEEWQGYNEQTDDVLVVGFKV